MWAERGHGGREQRVETGVFESAEQSVLGRGNFEIRLRILSYLVFFYQKDQPLSDEEVLLFYCYNLTSTHTVTFLTHFLHLLCLLPSRAVLAPNPS